MTCEYCEREVSYLTRDHIVPISKGGGSTRYNYAWICEYCNTLKADYYPHDFLDKIEMTLMYNIRSAHDPQVFRNIHRNLLAILRDRGFYRLHDRRYRLHPYKRKKGFVEYAKPAKQKIDLNKSVKVLVGRLNKEIRYANFSPAKIGQEVFEFDEDRFVIYVQKPHPITHDIYCSVQIRYYKATLAPMIEFIK